MLFVAKGLNHTTMCWYVFYRKKCPGKYFILVDPDIHETSNVLIITCFVLCEEHSDGAGAARTCIVLLDPGEGGGRIAMRFRFGWLRLQLPYF
jgi:hypothetical protein